MLSQNTSILMSNLIYKNINDLVIGDLIRTIDRSYAKVIFIYSGINRIYNIITNNFGIYKVTSNHKLALYNKEQYIIKTVEEIMKNKLYEQMQGYILSSDYPILYNFTIEFDKIDIYYGFNLNTVDNRIIIDNSIITYSK